jgi:hypothetical protein
VDWEWRKVKRSFGEKKRKELIDALQYWNSGLKAIVEKAEIPSPEDVPLAVKKIQARLTAEQCDKMRADLGLVHKAFQKAAWTCSCSEHCATIRIGWHMEKQATSGDFGFGFVGLHASPSWQLISVNIEESEEANATPATPVESPPPAGPEPKKRLGFANLNLNVSFRRKKHGDMVKNPQAPSK